MKSEKGGTPNFKRSSPTSTLMKELGSFLVNGDGTIGVNTNFHDANCEVSDDNEGYGRELPWMEKIE